MKKHSLNPEDAARLRRKAEEKVKLQESQKDKIVSEAEKLKLIHELQVYQVEIEMQNQELVIAKENAEQAEKKYTTLFDFAPIAYFNLTPNGDISQLNLAGAKMLGKERKSLINNKLALFFNSNTRVVFHDFFSKVLKDKGPERCEVSIANGGEAPIYALLTGTASDDGKHCLITASDITQRNQAENELKFQNILLKTQQEVSMDGIIIVNEDDKIISFNQRFADIWEIPDEIMALQSGDKALQYVRPKLTNPDEFAQGIYDLQKNKQEKSYDEVVLTDGKILERYSSPLIGSDDEYYGRIWYYRDITQRKQAQKELVEAKENAEESDHLKSAFLANMSHEIRTPMNGILGFAELLKEPGLSGDEQEAYIHIIEKSGKRMLNIINNIVDISKIEAGLIKLDMNRSDINEQVEYVCDFFYPEAEKKGIKLSFKTPLPAIEASIKTDREKVYAILINLVKNALKYTKKGSIQLGYNLKTDHERKVLEFYVKDTGIGIPKDRQETIFERFIQADIDDRMARQGAGLGLAIAKAYVDLLGGKIWVESEEGMDTTFYFTLPYNVETDAENTDRPIVPPEKYDGVKLKILIVEDDKVSEMLMDSYIKMYSKEVLKARTGVEAVEICRENPDIDLIMMDIRMPGMGGYEATKQIREFNKDVIIFAQTAYGLTGDREKSIRAGCDDYMAKPIKKEELMALIKSYF